MNETLSLSLSLSLSLFFKTNFIWFFWTMIGWSFNFINILPVFDFLALSYPLVLVLVLVLVRY